MRPLHSGEVLREDDLKPRGINVNALAPQLHVPASHINDIVLERRGITADTALRMAESNEALLATVMRIKPLALRGI